MLFVNYIYYCLLIAISLLFIWIFLILTQYLLNKYYGRHRFRFAQIYYHDNEQYDNRI